MNEIEIVIETLKDMKGVFDTRSHKQYSLFALDLAISSLEKQIPRKPIDSWESDTKRRVYRLCRWVCPNCRTFLGFENKYCTECGIKIKWDVIA